MTRGISSVEAKIAWAKLLAMVDDSAAVIIRGAFSTLVREMHDLVVAVFDAEGRLIATSSLGSPGLAGTLPYTMKQFVGKFPAGSIRPGDVFTTNDPWISTGHLNDFTIAEPVFHGGRLVGWAACTVHVEDIGGIGPTIRGQEIYDEGLCVPPCRFVEGGKVNELLFDILRTNVRTPDSVMGDLHSAMAAAHVLSEKLQAMLQQMGWVDLQGLADEVIERTERATRTAIAAIPDGVYRHSILIDSYKDGVDPLPLAVAVTVKGEDIALDFAGTAPQVSWGINAALNVVRGYGFFPLKCILDPETPLNEGFMRVIGLSAPEGCLVNALRPAPVWGRLVVGYFLPELIFAALAPAIPDRVVAGSGGVPMWANYFDGRTPTGQRFITAVIPQGGMGARADKDGISTMAWPGNLAMVPVEIMESETGMLCEEMQFATDSAGAGRFRGGLGQRLVLSIPTGDRAPKHPIRASLRGSRLRFPGDGFLGGDPTPLGKLRLNDRAITAPGLHQLSPGDRLVYDIPGGGGFSAPQTRDPQAVAEDVRDGYVSAAAARDIYAVQLLPDGNPDHSATETLRRSRALTPDQQSTKKEG